MRCHRATSSLRCRAFANSSPRLVASKAGADRYGSPLQAAPAERCAAPPRAIPSCEARPRSVAMLIILRQIAKFGIKTKPRPEPADEMVIVARLQKKSLRVLGRALT